MTDEQTNTAIAEALGYVVVRGQLCCTHTTSRGEPEPLPVGDGSVPNYTEDLNAMHEAEKLLTNMRLQVEWHNKRRTAFVVYKYMLRSVTNTSNSKYPTEWMDFCLLHATPAQRAEAFLKTFGKWEH